jgi:hypothetical protein
MLLTLSYCYHSRLSREDREKYHARIYSIISSPTAPALTEDSRPNGYGGVGAVNTNIQVSGVDVFPSTKLQVYQNVQRQAVGNPQNKMAQMHYMQVQPPPVCPSSVLSQPLLPIEQTHPGTFYAKKAQELFEASKPQ